MKNPFFRVTNTRIIHVGRLVKWKRVDLLIHTVARLSVKFPEIELIIIGDGPELNNLKKLSLELKIEKRIIFVGSVYDPVMLGRYYKCSTVYVLGGMGGLSINEAMVFEKPIICSICDGTERNLVRNGYNGYLFENGNLEDLIEKLTLLLSDEDKIKAFGKNSLNIIQSKININTVVSGYLKAFNSVMNNSTKFI